MYNILNVYKVKNLSINRHSIQPIPQDPNDLSICQKQFGNYNDFNTFLGNILYYVGTFNTKYHHILCIEIWKLSWIIVNTVQKFTAIIFDDDNISKYILLFSFLVWEYNFNLIASYFINKINRYIFNHNTILKLQFS